MAKTPDHTAEVVENVEFPTFDASKATDQFRAGGHDSLCSGNARLA
jgi:hypothetical protein